MRSALVYIYGPPAVGKLTVATELAAVTGYRLFHNHLSVNAINGLFEFGSEPFTEVLHRFRLDVFRVASRSGINLIFTNNSAWSGPDSRRRFVSFAEQAAQVVADEGGRTLFVRLTAPLSVLESRVVDASRMSHRKLVDVDRLREMVGSLDQSPVHPDDLTIDTGAVDVGEAVRLIVEWMSGSGRP